jgi:hypothetical protein
MAQLLAFGQHRASVRSASGSLNALSSSGGRRPAGRGHGLGAARHLGLGGLDAPRLVRHAAQRHRPVPSRCTMAATDTSAKA